MRWAEDVSLFITHPASETETRVRGVVVSSDVLLVLLLLLYVTGVGCSGVWQ